VWESNDATVRESFAAVFTRRPDLDVLQQIHAAPASAEAWRRVAARRIPATQR